MQMICQQAATAADLTAHSTLAWNMAGVSGVSARLTPLFTARLLCPASRLLKAMCRLTREEEQAAGEGGRQGG